MNEVPYNFARPAKLPGDGQQRLTTWFRGALKLAAKGWTKEFTFETTPELRESDTMHAKEAVAKFSERSTGFRILLAESELPSLLIFPRPLLMGLISAVLGEVAAAEQTDRRLTVVEQSLAEYFLQSFWLPFFKDTWPASNQITWQLGQMEAEPLRSRVFDLEEPVICFSWTLQTAMGEQACYWLFRKKGLDQLLGSEDTDIQTPENAKERLDTLVRGTPLDLSILLGSVDLRVSQLSQLRVGDLIILNQRVNEPLTARVEGEKKFLGWGGRTGISKAFQIESLKEK